MLKELMSRWMSGCKVQCWLMGWIILGFPLRRINAYCCIGHIILVAKSCDGVCRELVRCVKLFCENLVHSHWSPSVVMVAMKFHLWS